MKWLRTPTPNEPASNDLLRKAAINQLYTRHKQHHPLVSCDCNYILKSINLLSANNSSFVDKNAAFRKFNNNFYLNENGRLF